MCSVGLYAAPDGQVCSTACDSCDATHLQYDVQHTILTPDSLVQALANATGIPSQDMAVTSFDAATGQATISIIRNTTQNTVALQSLSSAQRDSIGVSAISSPRSFTGSVSSEGGLSTAALVGILSGVGAVLLLGIIAAIVVLKKKAPSAAGASSGSGVSRTAVHDQFVEKQHMVQESSANSDLLVNSDVVL